VIVNALSIAGTDPAGGAGIQADLKTFSALGAYGTAVVTALVAQNTREVTAVHQVPGAFVRAQLETLLDDVRIDTVKIGMLGSADVVDVVADVLARHRPRFVVLDPVLAATSGDRLLSAEATTVLVSKLLPKVDLVTPNLAEAAALLSEPPAVSEAEMRHQVGRLAELCPGVLLKGGHLPGGECVDLAWVDGQEARFAAPRMPTRNSRGTGCTLSSAVAALRPLRPDWRTAIGDAKADLTHALEAADVLDVGRGAGPVHHFHTMWSAGPG
jgi:hydroxymethylpyrimidine/phosphomethylpyrimidine kinase